MPGHLKYRPLSRSSSHRQSLLRNLVTSLLTHESISTTWHKAKEAQRLAEKLITLSKRNSNASRTRAQQILYTPGKHISKLFGELRQRYAARPGGYTRVLNIEPLNRNDDQARSAILELVDGPRDMRFAMTARSLVRERAAAATADEGRADTAEGDLETNGPTRAGPAAGAQGIRDITAKNVRKVTRYREGGEDALLREVERLEEVEREQRESSGRRREKALKEKDEAMEKYYQEDAEWRSMKPRERRKNPEPEKPDEDLDEEEFEVRPRREGWESYPAYQMEQRTRRRKKYEERSRERLKRT